MLACGPPDVDIANAGIRHLVREIWARRLTLSRGQSTVTLSSICSMQPLFELRSVSMNIGMNILDKQMPRKWTLWG